MDTLTKEILERIAKMESFGMSPSKIATATSLTESRISQIRAMDEYRQIFAQTENTELEKFQTLNDGWDNIEAMSLNTIITALKINPDGDFALRAATIANRAQRRGRQNVPIGVNAGARAVVYLNGNFVEKLQQNFQITNNRDTLQLAQKDASFTSPSVVEKLLRMPKTIEQKNNDFVVEQIHEAFAMG